MYMTFQTKFRQTLNGNFHMKQKKEKNSNCMFQYNFTISLRKFTLIIMGEGFTIEDNKSMLVKTLMFCNKSKLNL